jgi:homoserine kinase
MAKAMESDIVVEPARAHLMPYMEEVRFSAKRAGAYAVVISGAGPTLCAVCDESAVAERVAMAMQAIYDHVRIGCRVRHGTVLQEGAQVLSVR